MISFQTSQWSALPISIPPFTTFYSFHHFFKVLTVFQQLKNQIFHFKKMFFTVFHLLPPFFQCFFPVFHNFQINHVFPLFSLLFNYLTNKLKSCYYLQTSQDSVSHVCRFFDSMLLLKKHPTYNFRLKECCTILCIFL